MGAVLREAGLRDSDKNIIKVSKHILDKNGVEDAINKIDMNRVRAARASSSRNMIRPSVNNPISRALKAKLTQIGAYPAPAVVGRILYDLIHGQNFDFDMWVKHIRENQFNEIWDIIQSEVKKGSADSRGSGAKSVDTKGATAQEPALDDPAKAPSAIPAAPISSESKQDSASTEPRAVPPDVQPAPAQPVTTVDNRATEPAVESANSAPPKAKSKGTSSDKNQPDLPL